MNPQQTKNLPKLFGRGSADQNVTRTPDLIQGLALLRINSDPEPADDDLNEIMAIPLVGCTLPYDDLTATI